uniref:Polyprotein n=1 Tax=Aphid lethal paralysis virus TaxID=209529 RepID=A0A221LEK0_ALPV|nr:polyprotein [Aphid lethal paralysis virus]
MLLTLIKQYKMSETFSTMLPRLNIQLSIPEIDQLKKRDVQTMESPRFVPQMTQSALNNMNNVYIMTDSLDAIPENTLSKQVLAYITEFNELHNGVTRPSRIAQLDSNIAYLTLYLDYLMQHLKTHSQVKDCFFLMLKTIAIAKGHIFNKDDHFYSIAIALRLINASLATILNKPEMSQIHKYPRYCSLIRDFLKVKTTSNSVTMKALLADHCKYTMDQFKNTAVANNIMLNAEFRTYVQLIKQIKNNPFIRNSLIDMIFALYVTAFHFTTDADITESGSNETLQYLNTLYITKLTAQAQVGLSFNHNITVDNNLEQAINKSLTMFADLTNAISDKLQETVADYQRKIVALITTIYNLYRFSTRKMDLQDLIVNVFGALGSAGIASSLVTQLVTSIRAYFVASIAQIEPGSQLLILKALSLTMFCLFVKQLPGKNTIDEFVTRLDRFPKAISGLESMWSKLDVVVKQMYAFMEEKILKKHNRFNNTDMLQDVLDWASEVEKYLELANRNEIKRDPGTVLAASKLYPRGVRLIKECTQLKLSPANLNLIRSLLPATKQLADEAIKSGALKQALRPEPLIVWFCGKSGMGKTGMSYPFMMDMMRVFGDIPADFQKNIYGRVPETEYWDGYTDQEYIIYDDAFQIKDNVLKPNPELFEIIRLGNAFPVMLHMASVEEKNNTFANPKCVLLTSNLDRIKTESLNSPEAVQRRIDFAYNVDIAEEYREYYTDSNGNERYKLNAVKARAEARKLVGTSVSNNLNIYRFTKFSAFDGRTIETDMTYAQVTEECSMKMASRFNQHMDFTNYLDAYRNPIYEPEEIVEFPIEAQAEVGNMARVAAGNTAGFLVTNHCLRKYLHGDDDTILMALLRKTKRTMENILDYTGLVPRARDLWEQPSWDYHLYYARQIKQYLKDASDGIMETLAGFFGKYWQFVKQAVLVGVSVFSTYMCVKASFALGDYVKGKIVPKYISDDDQVAQLVSEANACLDKGCNNCKLCKNAAMKQCNVKWNSACLCYVKRMEKGKDMINKYAISLYGNQRVSNNHEISVSDMAEIINQVADCDCNTCDCCNDPELLDRLATVARIHGTNCVCLLTRFYQGFKTADLYDMTKQINNTLPSIIKNPELKRLIDSHARVYDNAVSRRANSTRIVGHGATYDARPRQRQMATKIGAQAPVYDNRVTIKKNTILAAQNLLPAFAKIEPIEKTMDIQTVPACKGCDNCSPIDAQRSLPEQDKGSIVIARDVVYRNLFRFTVVLNENGTEKRRGFGQIFMLGGRLGMIPKHFLSVMEHYVETYGQESCFFVLENCSNTISPLIPCSVILKQENHIKDPHRDIAIIQLPTNVGGFAQAYKHIIDEQDLARVSDSPAILARYQNASERDRRQGTNYYREIFWLSTATPEDHLVESTVPEANVVVQNRGSYTYHAVTFFGDCGSILIASNAAITQKIMGMHIAGITHMNKGISVALTRQIIDRLMKHFQPISQYGHEIVPLDVNPDILKENGTFLIYGTEPGRRIMGSVKTALQKSPAYGKLIESPNKPGYLRPFTDENGTTIDPMTLQRNKYGVVRPYVPQQRVDAVYEAMSVFYQREYINSPAHYKLPLTREQAIIGINGDPFINAINRQTAPGYPYTYEKEGKSGKTKWFGDGMDYDLTNDACKQLMADVDELAQCMLDNVRPRIIWIDTLKDAKIPIAKANVGKTRLFTACPLHYTILFRQYFLPFIAHAMRNRVQNSIAVGINPMSPEWDLLAKRLKRNGKHVIAGDYSNFDGTLPVQYVEVAVKIMVDWFMRNWDQIVAADRHVINGHELKYEEFEQFLMKIGVECINHLHIANHSDDSGAALIYYVRNGIPSGCPATAILNSIVNHCCLADSWLDIMDGTSYATMNSFFEHTSSIFYGDDFIMNIRPEIIDVYNQETLTPVLKKNLEMTMTDEAKTGECVKARTLEEVSFLKRKFRFETFVGLWVAPIDIDVIVDAPNWVRIGNQLPLRICVDTLSGGLTELAMHDKATDAKWRTKMINLGLDLTRGTGLEFNPDSRSTTLLKLRNEELGGDFEVNY